MIEKIKNYLSQQIESALVDTLFKHYNELKQKFFLGQYEPSELNCAKFAEVVMRILEYLTTGKYTGFDKEVSLDVLSKNLEGLSKDSFPISVRIHIPRILKAIYDIRSKRGVTHIKELDPNSMDAAFVVSACDWIVAELVRLYSTGDPKEAQKIVNSIIERKFPIIEEFEDDIKVLRSDFTVRKKILVILYYKYPDYVAEINLKKWIKTKSPSHIPTVLGQLDNEAMIHRKNETCKITRKGIIYVEKNIPKEINL